MSALGRLARERGSALLVALILVVLLGAVGAVALLAGQSETLLSANYRQGHEALYVADGALNRALKDLADLPDWTPILAGIGTSSFVDGPAIGPKPLPAGGAAVLCCDSASLTGELQARGYGGGDWGADTPEWRIYAWGPASLWLTASRIYSVFYSVVWVADDPADGDGNPWRDSNGIVALVALSIGPRGAHRAVHAVVQRVPPVSSAPPRVRVLSWSESRW
jgi:hypothetical protein